MRSGISLAATIVTGLLAATALFLRMQNDRAARATPTAQSGIRVGIILPDGEQGAVIAPASQVVRRAIETLGLPDTCVSAAARRPLADGDLLDFSSNGGRCQSVLQNQLTGAVRLTLGLPLDINTENASGLALLPGIGPQKGAAVEAYRNAHGPFLSVDDLINVHGIGPKTLERLRPWVVCDDFER